MLKPSAMVKLKNYRTILLKDGFHLKVLKNNYLNLLFKKVDFLESLKGNLFIIYRKDLDSLNEKQFNFIFKFIQKNFIVVNFLFQGTIYFRNKLSLLTKFKNKNNSIINVMNSLQLFMNFKFLETLKCIK